MGEPQKLICVVCEQEYFLHPADHRPVEYANHCVTCEYFAKGMKRLRAEGDPLVMTDKDMSVMGKLVLLLSALVIVILVAWGIWRVM